MKKILEWKLPIKTISEANDRQHWVIRWNRHRVQKGQVIVAFHKNRDNLPSVFPLPCLVKLTRVAPRFLDSDNLQAALKYIRDEVANQIIPGKPPGMADGDPRIVWKYDQVKNKEYAVNIEIYDLMEAA